MGSGSLKSLFNIAKASVLNLAAFKAELAKGSAMRRRSRTTPKKEEPLDGAREMAKKEEEDGDSEQEHEEEDETPTHETPMKRQSLVSLPAPANTTPMVVIVLGAANGNAATAAADATIESGKTIHTLVLELSKTACEFAQQRVEKKVYTEWHAGKLEWNNMLPLKPRVRERDGQVQYDATPLTIRNGRLRIPEALLAEFLEDEATQEMAEDLMVEHAKRFHTGEHSLAKLELAKQGVGSGGKDDNNTQLPDPPCHTSDPMDADGLALLPKVQVAVSPCEKYKIFVSNAGVFVMAQTPVELLAGDRIGEFGSGGFRAPAEIQECLESGGGLTVNPVLNNDMDEVMLLTEDAGNNTKTPAISYLSFQAMVGKLLEEGAMSWPFQVLLHNVSSVKPASKGERTRFTLASTNEKVWVTLNKKGKVADGDRSKVSWANVFKFVADAGTLNNNVVKIVLQARAVSQLGSVRLERPCVVWAKPFELNAGAVVRIG